MRASATSDMTYVASNNCKILMFDDNMLIPYVASEHYYSEWTTGSNKIITKQPITTVKLIHSKNTNYSYKAMHILVYAR